MTSTGRVFAYGDTPTVPAGTELAASEDAVVAAGANGSGGVWLAHADGAVVALGGALHHGDMSGNAAQRSDPRHVTKGRRQGLLAARLRRRHLRVRQGTFLRLDRGANARRADHRPHPDTVRGPAIGCSAKKVQFSSFGDAGYHGGPNAIPGGLHKPATSITAGPGGYWIIADGGGIFAYDEPYYGSLPGLYPGVALPDAVRIRSLPGAGGYYIVTADGTLYGFGAVPDLQANRPSLAPGERIVDLILF